MFSIFWIICMCIWAILIAGSLFFSYVKKNYYLAAKLSFLAIIPVILALGERIGSLIDLIK